MNRALAHFDQIVTACVALAAIFNPWLTLPAALVLVVVISSRVALAFVPPPPPAASPTAELEAQIADLNSKVNKLQLSKAFVK